jgi:hypothetical protein
MIVTTRTATIPRHTRNAGCIPDREAARKPTTIRATTPAKTATPSTSELLFMPVNVLRKEPTPALRESRDLGSSRGMMHSSLDARLVTGDQPTQHGLIGVIAHCTQASIHFLPRPSVARSSCSNAGRTCSSTASSIDLSMAWSNSASVA